MQQKGCYKCGVWGSNKGSRRGEISVGCGGQIRAVEGLRLEEERKESREILEKGGK